MKAEKQKKRESKLDSDASISLSHNSEMSCRDSEPNSSSSEEDEADKLKRKSELKKCGLFYKMKTRTLDDIIEEIEKD